MGVVRSIFESRTESIAVVSTYPYVGPYLGQSILHSSGVVDCQFNRSILGQAMDLDQASV